MASPTLRLGTLELPEGWRSLSSGRPREAFEGEILPTFFPRQRWFASKDRPADALRLAEQFELYVDHTTWLLCIVETPHRDGELQRYFLPLAMAWDTDLGDGAKQSAQQVLSRVRVGTRTGLLKDAFADDRFVQSLLAAVRGDVCPRTSRGQLRCQAIRKVADSVWNDGMEIRRAGTDQSNTSLRIGNSTLLKGYRRLAPGVHPELEIGRFLTDTAGYGHVPPLLGSVEYVSDAGEMTALGIVQSFVPHRSDAWTTTRRHLDRLLHEGSGPEARRSPPDQAELYGRRIHQLGVRTAGLHRALSLRTGDPNFDPEPVSPEDLDRWRQQCREQAQVALNALNTAGDTLPESARDEAHRLLAAEHSILDHIDALAPRKIEATKTRYHGDYHLGQVLVTDDDYWIIDFEGEPARPLALRRQKHSALRDVAGMLRSFNYAAWSSVLACNGPSARVNSIARAWEKTTAAAFLAGYRAAIKGCRSCPRDQTEMERLVAMFSLEKALYEVAYELSHRPEWVEIPLHGVLDLLTASQTWDA